MHTSDCAVRKRLLHIYISTGFRSPSLQDIFLHQKQLGNFKEGDAVSFGVPWQV